MRGPSNPIGCALCTVTITEDGKMVHESECLLERLRRAEAIALRATTPIDFFDSVRCPLCGWLSYKHDLKKGGKPRHERDCPAPAFLEGRG